MTGQLLLGSPGRLLVLPVGFTGRSATPWLCRKTSAPSMRPSARLAPVRALQEQQKSDAAKVADSVGLPTDEGLFGFKPFAEVWVGRLAMAGFATSVVQEFTTGKGTLKQIGLLTPNPLLLNLILALAGGLTVAGFGRTIYRARSGKLSKAELERYGSFLSLSNEASQIAETETEMKQGWQGDKPGTPPASLTGSASDNPTDTFCREDIQPTKDWSTSTLLQQNDQFSDPGQRYARDVEVTNGRLAMLGFLACVAVEAATGRGILSQVIWYLKLVNILGPASGF